MPDTQSAQPSGTTLTMQQWTLPGRKTIRFHLSAKVFETGLRTQNCYGMRWLYLIGKSYLFTVTTRGGVGVVDPTPENCCTHLNLTPL